jgi:hypothetical protein
MLWQPVLWQPLSDEPGGEKGDMQVLDLVQAGVAL